MLNKVAPRLVIASTLGPKGPSNNKEVYRLVILAKARIQILKGFKSYYELDPRSCEDDKPGKFFLIQRIAETSLEGVLLALEQTRKIIMRIWIASRRPLRGYAAAVAMTRRKVLRKMGSSLVLRGLLGLGYF